MLKSANPTILLGLLFLGACAETNPPAPSISGPCQSVTTPITEIQGRGFYSPLVGSQLTVRGTVTRVAAASGFYIESMESEVDPKASKALFISDDELAQLIHPGQDLELSGRVAEPGSGADKLTSLVAISGYNLCADAVELPLTRVQLPLDSTSREALEGMRVHFEQALTVTDVYKLARGEMTLSANGVLRVPTEVVEPGPSARRLESENRDHAIVVILPESSTTLAVGATTQHVTGVLGNNERSQQLLLESTPEMSMVPTPLPEPAGDRSVRVVSSNLLNFFNGDGKGGGFPTERGAETPGAFLMQSARTRAAMEQIQPDLLAVQELENDGFGPESAAQSLLQLLNDSGHNDWVCVAPGPGRIGSDAITVGLFYRQQALEAVGPPRVLDTPPFQRLSRQPLAQLFRETRTGETFLVAVNHLKSKGSCPDGGENRDRDDGQGCWSSARLDAVKSLVPWLQGLAEQAGTRNILVLGDMNSWRKEDPISQFRDSGFVDLVETLSGLPQHSFLYWGQTGTLDYAFASRAMTAFARKALIWHINADWPAGMDQARPWLRTSDHDPVIVDFDFNQSRTSR